ALVDMVGEADAAVRVLQGDPAGLVGADLPAEQLAVEAAEGAGIGRADRGGADGELWCGCHRDSSVDPAASSCWTSLRGATPRYASWMMSATRSQSTSPSSRTPTQPRWPT